MSGSFTMAQNFTSSVDRDIDPRTGQFKPVINLGEVHGNSGVGPSLPITLTYSPYNSMNQGFGTGWSFAVASFDVINSVLTHPNGSNWALADIATTTSDLPLKYQRVKDFRFRKTGDGGYCIWNSSGDTVLIGGKIYKVGSTQLQLASTILNASGHQISFKFDDLGRVLNVYDGDGTTQLLSVSYDTQFPVIRMFPGQPFEKLYVFQIQAGYLEQISCKTVESGYIYWKMENGINSDNPNNVMFGENKALLSITYPTGQKTSVIYNIYTEGFKNPDNKTFTPNLKSSETNHGGGQPSIKKKYSYGDTGRNYLGYDSGIPATSTNDDELYKSPYNNYEYVVTELVLDENNRPAFSTTYTYNKYHLLKEEFFTDTQGNGTRKTTNTYDASLFDQTPYEKLPCWFQNPISISVNTSVNNNGTVEEKELTRSYEYYGEESPYCQGMIKSQIFANKKKISYEYYRADGTEPGCAKNPYVIASIANGWPSNYHKSIKVSDISGSEVEIVRLEFDYISQTKKADANPNFPNDIYLMQSEIRLFSAGQYAIQKTYQYYNDRSATEYGNIKNISINSINQNGNQNSSSPGISPVKSETYIYKYTDDNDKDNPNSIVKTTLRNGSYNTSNTDYICKYRGIINDRIDHFGNRSKYEYGTTNALLTDTYLPNDTFFQTAISHTYDKYTDNNGDFFNTVVTELTISHPAKDQDSILHSGQKQWLDGANRQIKLAQAIRPSNTDPDKLDYKQNFENNFNYFGESKSITSLDELPGIDSEIPINATSTKNNIYNAFCALSGYEFPNYNSDPHIISSEFNPQTTTTNYHDNTLTYNRSRIVDIINGTMVDKVFTEGNNTELHKVVHTFSKFGPLSNITEIVTDTGNGTNTTFSYDFNHDGLGRPTSKNYGDGSTITLEYDPRFYLPLITKIVIIRSNSTRNTILECSYNERGLLEKRSLPGRDLSYNSFYSYQYDPSYPRVISATQPDRTTVISYSYNDNIGGKLKQVSTSDNRLKNYEYNNLGQLINITESYNGLLTFGTTRSVDALGRTTNESYRTGDKPYAEIGISYSDANSKITTFTDANGIKTYNYYNNAMQLIRTENQKMRAEFVYDIASRLVQKYSWKMATWDKTTNTGTPDETTKQSSFYTYDKASGDLIKIDEQDRGVQKLSVQMTYRTDGLLTSRTYIPASLSPSYARKETFVYDARKRLVTYQCDGSSLIMNSDGDRISQQTYMYDELNNILSIKTLCKTATKSQLRLMAFTYNNKNPFLLSTVKIDQNPVININYDPIFDRALNDDQGRIFTYDSFERIDSVTKNGKKTSFRYDAFDAMRIQSNPNKDFRYLFYDGTNVNAEYTTNMGAKKNSISRIYSEHGYLGQTDGLTGNYIAVPLDGSNDPIFTPSSTDELSNGTAPFGDSYQVSNAIPSYRGELYNESLGGYFLGNGYRVYNPRLCRFNAPDSLGPHTNAGVNPFCYAHNDPINYADPSGHTPQGNQKSHRWENFEIFLGIVAVAAVATVAFPAIAAGGISAAVLTGVAPELVMYALAAGSATLSVETTNTNPTLSAVSQELAIGLLGMGGYGTYGDAKEASKLGTAGKLDKEVETGDELSKSRRHSSNASKIRQPDSSIGKEEHEALDDKKGISRLSSQASSRDSQKVSVIKTPVKTDLNINTDANLIDFEKENNTTFTTTTNIYLNQEETTVRKRISSDIRDNGSNSSPIINPENGIMATIPPAPPPPPLTSISMSTPTASPVVATPPEDQTVSVFDELKKKREKSI